MACFNLGKSRGDRLTICEAILKHAPHYNQAQLDDADFVRDEIKRLGADVASPVLAHAGLGALQLALFEETAEAQLWNPTYIIDYPSRCPRSPAPQTRAPGLRNALSYS